MMMASPFLSRRSLLIGAATMPLLGRMAHAKLELDIRQGNFAPVPIAIVPFAGDDASRSVTGVIENNLRRSGFFQVLDRASFVDQLSGPDATPNFPSWQAIKAEGLLTGRATRAGDGRIKVECHLWDVASGRKIAAQMFQAGDSYWRRTAHMVSDLVFEKITGAKGHFDTRIVYVDESGSKEKRVKRLAIMDQDGAGSRYITKGGDLVLTPRFSPSSQDICYMAYSNDEPRVFLLNIENGQREAVGNFPGMTFSPRFAPDGQRVILSLQQGAGSSIYAMDLRSKNATRLTDGSAIDTSPCFSPDGQKIAFESDRGGTQQLYVMAAGGGAANRISFGQGRYSTPVWSPRGDLIAFTRQSAGQFAIGVMRPDGSGERVITTGYHNEGPTFSPNGLYLMFFRDGGGGPQLFQSDIYARAEMRVPTPSFASDPAWSPSLSS